MRRKFTLYERNLATLELAEEARHDAELAMYAVDTFSTRDRFIKARTAYENAYGRVRSKETRMEASGLTVASAEAAVAAADRACGLAYKARWALRNRRLSPEYAKAQEAFAKSRRAFELAEIDLIDAQTAEDRRAIELATCKLPKLGVCSPLVKKALRKAAKIK